MNEEILLGIDEDIESSEMELDGLGRRMGVPSSPVVKRFARAYAANRVRKSNVAAIRSRGQAFLDLKKSTFDPNTRKALAAGQLTYGDGIFYIRKAVTGLSGIQEMFGTSGTMDKVVGYTNLQNARLPENVNLAMQRIEVEFATEAGATVTGTNTQPLSPSSPAGLFNGEIEVMAGGKSLLRIPVSQCQQSRPGDVSSPKNGYNLKAMKMIHAGEDVQIRVHFAGALAGTNPEILAVNLIGDITALK